MIRNFFAEKRLEAIQTKPYPAGINTLFVGKPEYSLGEYRNSLEVIITGEDIEKDCFWECRPPSKKWKWWLYDHIGKWLEKQIRKIKPMKFYNYSISVRLSEEEKEMLIKAIRTER